MSFDLKLELFKSKVLVSTDCVCFCALFSDCLTNSEAVFSTLVLSLLWPSVIFGKASSWLFTVELEFTVSVSLLFAEIFKLFSSTFGVSFTDVTSAPFVVAVEFELVESVTFCCTFGCTWVAVFWITSAFTVCVLLTPTKNNPKTTEHTPTFIFLNEKWYCESFIDLNNFFIFSSKYYLIIPFSILTLYSQRDNIFW